MTDDTKKSPEEKESKFDKEKLLKLWEKINRKRKERYLLRKMREEKKKDG
jgi:hypothetical protein